MTILDWRLKCECAVLLSFISKSGPLSYITKNELYRSSKRLSQLACILVMRASLTPAKANKTWMAYTMVDAVVMLSPSNPASSKILLEYIPTALIPHNCAENKMKIITIDVEYKALKKSKELRNKCKPCYFSWESKRKFASFNCMSLLLKSCL